jgi:hypothetical protein
VKENNYYDTKWDAERIRTYKCGTHPKVGDLVIRRFANKDYPKEYGYGIVTGKHKLATGLVLPVIFWCGHHGKPKRCISKNVELVVRNENNV